MVQLGGETGWMGRSGAEGEPLGLGGYGAAAEIVQNVTLALPPVCALSVCVDSMLRAVAGVCVVTDCTLFS